MGDVDIGVMLLLLEIESKIHRLGGAFGRPAQGRFFKLKKGIPKELRGACPLVIRVL